ncbi:hypothetical protein CC86DRAFT_367855 [Ophiobolus disseminans]|uniref:Uncharacterized protein n=1 Tax=Ophiobolus disseminans TaxID=1469910 RepID=A0A6A7A9Y5_9PLEO|nr:hypothetical protein CC86DRAFT_367855 [Ophiobolus disseminans]
MNIFSHEIPDGMLSQLLALSPPEDPVAYGHYVKEMMHKTFNLTLREPRSDPTWDRRFNAFTTRVYHEIVRIASMPSGHRTALHLSLDLELDVLCTHTTHPSKHCVQLHDDIHDDLSRMLKAVARRPDRPFLALASASRKLKTEMLRVPCSAVQWLPPDNNACEFNIPIPTLDLLQRHAYFEIQHTVQLAVGKRLPSELTRLIVEEAVKEECQMSDPRVLVLAHHALPKRGKALMCLIPFRHDTRGWHEGFDGGQQTRCGRDFRYTFNTPHEKSLPVIPYSISSFSDLENAAEMEAEYYQTDRLLLSGYYSFNLFVCECRSSSAKLRNSVEGIDKQF